MKIQDFLKLNSDHQLAWIDQNIEEYEVLLYNDGYLGCSYPTEQIDLEEYENYPMDYDVSGMIKNQLASITASRMEEIDEGAKLNDHEREALACAIAEEDTDGWLGHHGFQIDLDDGSVFTYFVGHSIGQGGASFNFIGIYSSKEDLIEVIQEEPSFALS